MADHLIGEEEGILRSVSDTPPTHYAVKLEGFSLIKEDNAYTSAEFEAGGYTWTLSLYPKGYDNGNISIYVMLEESSLPHIWSEVHAVFRVFLLDQFNDNYYTLQVANARRFRRMTLERGFDEFMPLEEFKDPSNGYLIDDTCVFGVEIYVSKESNIGMGESFVMVKNVYTHKHTWEILSFSFIAHDQYVHESKYFNSGGQKWKIQLYPTGSDTGTDSHISIYLALADEATLPIASRIYAEFTIRMIGDFCQVNDKNFHAKGWFSASSPSYGWPMFISLTEFNASSNRFLVDNECTIEAEVTVHAVSSAL